MKARTARKVRDALLIAGIAVMLLGYFFEAFLWIGGVIAFAALIPHFVFYKCPHCGRLLGRNEGAFCQHCGGAIDEE